MPAKKKTPAKKSVAKKKPSAQKSAPTSAERPEVGMAFWVALIIVVLAIGASAVFATLPKLDDLGVPEIVDMEEEESEEEVVESEEDASSLALSIIEAYEGGATDQFTLAQEFGTRIQSEYGTLPKVDQLRDGVRRRYDLVAVPQGLGRQDYCGNNEHGICLLTSVSGPNVSLLHVFEGVQGDLQFLDYKDGTLLFQASGVAHGVEERTISAFTFGASEGGGYRVLGHTSSSGYHEDEEISSVTVFHNGPREEALIEFTYLSPVDGASRLIVSAPDDSFDIVLTAADELSFNWQAMIDRPDEVLFSVAGSDYVYNRDGEGAFQAE